MSENDNTQAIIDAVRAGAEPVSLTDGIWLVQQNGVQTTINLTDEIEQAQERPNRKTGNTSVVDVASFAGYLAKHGTEETELYGFRDSGSVLAIINAGSGTEPGWRDHKLVMTLRHSDDWKEWGHIDGKWMRQDAFAEFIEDHLPNFGNDPTGAEMLELARSFKATQRVEFGHGQHAGGKTTVSYTNTSEAKAGQKGDLEFPDHVTLGVYVFDQGQPYAIGARLRYRVSDGALHLSFKLDRPSDVLQTAFDDVLDDVQSATGRKVWSSR